MLHALRGEHINRSELSQWIYLRRNYYKRPVIFAHGYRNGWNVKGAYVILETPTKIGFIPYLLFRAVNGDFMPFVASNTDLFATDWVIQAN